MKTINAIVVGFDVSVDSQSAVRWAAAAAREVGADLTVRHASGLLERLSPSFSDDEFPDVVSTITSQEGRDTKLTHWVVDEGDACTALPHCASPPINAQLLVVGSRGHGKRPGMMIGGVSLEVVQHAHVPVVVVPGR